MLQVGSRCQTYYGKNYCFTVMYGCYMVGFRCVINHVSDMFLITCVTWLGSSGRTIFVHVLRVLIESNGYAITYHLFAYVLINADKIIELHV